MPRLILLGTANAVPDDQHDNTHMLLLGQERVVLIDCATNPLRSVRRAGLDVQSITDLILTHFHPDHASGLPMLLMNMWLQGRTRPLEIHGLDHCLDRAEQLMDMYSWKEWPHFFPVSFHRLPLESGAAVLSAAEFTITAAPTQHFIPCIGLRVECSASGRVLAYSGDTAPCPAVVRMAQGADVLLHEASGALPGHSSAAQAGLAAREAEAGQLYLIHTPVDPAARAGLLAEARQAFPGPVALAEDLLTIDL